MFRVSKEQKNGFVAIVLIDDSNGTTVHVIPGCGAMLHAFTIKNGEENLNVIESYKSKTEYDAGAESNGFKGLKLSPFPCRLQDATYSFGNTQYKLNSNFPNGVAIHGFLYNKPFTIVKQHADENSAIVEMLYNYNGDNSGYPFLYSCEVTYTLETGNQLTVQTKITNTGNTALPIADGWHPYFTFHKKIDELTMQFNSTSMLEFVNLFPTGKVIPNTDFLKPRLIGDSEIDNSFILDFNAPQPMCTLKDGASGWQLEISPDKSYPYLQIYTPPHRNSIAIENLSAPPDAFNNKIGLIVLEPGKFEKFSTKYRLDKPFTFK